MEHHSPEAALAFIEHVRGGTSTNVLADIFREAGTPVSATTIKKYRRSLDER